MAECHCGKDGHPIGSINCPVHGTLPLLDRIEAYGFECEAGPLKNCVEWIELKKRLGA